MRSHQQSNIFRRLGEIYARFLLATLMEIDGTVGVLGLRLNASFGNIIQRPLNQWFNEVDGLKNQICRGVLWPHRNSMLGNDRPTIQDFIHLMHRDTNMGLAVQQCPQDRRESRIFRKQSIMDIQRTMPRHAKNLWR